MVCTHPLLAYQPSPGVKPTIIGRLSPLNYSVSENLMRLPCGQCISCRIDRSRTWAARCVLEADMQARLGRPSIFITLTFSDEHPDKTYTLNKRDFQLFIKRLRKYLSTNAPGQNIRYYHSAEYGENLSRPHHHACIFGYQFPDQKLYTIKQGHNYYTSDILTQLWSDPKTHKSYGFTLSTEVTFDSAAYVAGYIIDKINGKLAPSHYKDKVPEFSTRSLGLGLNWLLDYTNDVYNYDLLSITKKLKMKPPRYFDHYYELINPQHMEDIRCKRKEKAHERFLELTPERLGQIAYIQKHKTSKKHRKMEIIHAL